MKKFFPHFIALVIFIAISAIYFSPVILPPGKIISTHDIDNWKGMSKEVTDFRENTGDEALWTKRMFSGMPAYQISTRSNGNLIQYVDNIFQLGLPRPLDMLFLYLIGFYILLMTLKLDYRIAIIGAIGFAFSSYFIIIIQAGHMTKAHAIGYLPLIIASVLYTFKSEKLLLGAVFTALFVALQLYSNHYQITYYTILILIFIAIVQFIKDFKNKNLFNFFKKSIVLIFAALLAGATNYTRLGTTMEYANDTQRGQSELLTKDGSVKEDGLDKSYILRYSYGKAETMTFLIPNFHGGIIGSSVLVDQNGKLNKESETLQYIRNVRDPNKQEELQKRSLSYWGDYSPVENRIGPGSPTYVGAIICFLFVLGLFIVKSHYRYWILLSSLLSIFLGWGYNLPGFSEFFIDYFPAYNKFRAVTMIMVIAQFGIALLAMLALNKFLDSKGNNQFYNQKFKLAFYITGGITLAFSLFPSIFVDFISDTESLLDNNFIDALILDRESIMKSDAWRSFLFILFAAFSLWLFIKGKLKKQYVIFILGCLILTDMWTVNKRYLNDTHFIKESRSSFVATKSDEIILENNKNNSRVLNYRNTFNESRTSYFHNSIGGYHAAKLLRYQELIDKQLTTNNLAVLSMLNCGWIITPQGQALPSYTQGIKPLGDAWFVSETNIVNDANHEMESLNSFNPEITAVVDKRFSQELRPFIFDSTSKISLIQEEYKPNHLTYSLSNINSDQLAVFSEIYYNKGWNAYIDDKLVPHFRANYVLRAMMIPAGAKKIDFKFEPSIYHTGEKIALASSLLLLLLLSFVCFKELKSE